MLRLLIALALPTLLIAEPLRIQVEAGSAILINADTGTILFQKNPHLSQYPASITKIGTVSYALKQKGLSLDTPLTADQEVIASISSEAKIRSNYTTPSYWMEMGSSHMGIKKGEVLSVRDLLYGIMLISGNDASNMLSQHVGGTIPQFIEGMNSYFKEIGAKNTVFTNPHGLHHPNHKTTAYDMALITREAMKNPTFCQVVSTVKYLRPKTNKQEATTIVQSNRLLKQGQYYYPAAVGIKTGHTSKAQHTFVGAAKKDGRTLIAVFLKAKERTSNFRDAIKLFDAAFNQPKVEKVLFNTGPQTFAYTLEGAGKGMKTYLAKDVSLTYYPAEEPQVKCFLCWDPLELPIKKDQRVGTLRLVGEYDQILAEEPLLALEDLKAGWILGLSSPLFTILKILGIISLIFFGARFFLKK